MWQISRIYNNFLNHPAIIELAFRHIRVFLIVLRLRLRNYGDLAVLLEILRRSGHQHLHKRTKQIKKANSSISPWKKNKTSHSSWGGRYFNECDQTCLSPAGKTRTNTGIPFRGLNRAKGVWFTDRACCIASVFMGSTTTPLVYLWCQVEVRGKTQEYIHTHTITQRRIMDQHTRMTYRKQSGLSLCVHRNITKNSMLNLAYIVSNVRLNKIPLKRT